MQGRDHHEEPAVVKRKPKQTCQVQVNPDRVGIETKWLPPGQLREQWELYVQRQGKGGEKPASYATFWRIWKQDFPFLRLRSVRQHPECSECVKHKCLLRGLGHHLLARRRQQKLYAAHIHAQYQDRLCYWEHRGVSRTRGVDVTLICDGMDQAKFAYPRHPFLRSKEYSTWQRPRAHVIGCIIHGRAALFMVTPPDLRKDSSTHCEMIAWALTELRRQVDVTQCNIRIQCDNTSRECKNNPFVSFLCSLVARGCLAAKVALPYVSGDSRLACCC